jgi:hypothetical protein
MMIEVMKANPVKKQTRSNPMAYLSVKIGQGKKDSFLVVRPERYLDLKIFPNRSTLDTTNKLSTIALFQGYRMPLSWIAVTSSIDEEISISAPIMSILWSFLCSEPFVATSSFGRCGKFFGSVT